MLCGYNPFMSLKRQKSALNVDEYLAGERDASVRHEYLDGDVYAMAGGSRDHNTLAFNIAGLLHARLSPPCQGFVADMKVRIRTDESEWFYYPDVVVQCAEAAGDAYFLEQPVLIVEVISPSTERIDKYEKRLHYQQLNSLQDYVLVHQLIREVWGYRRSRQWEKEVYNEGAVMFPLLGMTLTLEEIYRGVRLD